MDSVYVMSGNVRIHCLDSGGDQEPLILCHGLTANAHCFDGYIKAGLAERFRVISIDLRGRGLSDKPDFDYSMQDHMLDLLAVMKHFKWDQALIGGHSFGAMLSIYTSYYHPEVFKAMIIIDAAARLHVDARQMVSPAMNRLGHVWDSKAQFLSQMKSSSYLSGEWDEDLESYFEADIKSLPDGRVTTQSALHHIEQAIEGSLGLGEEWLKYIQGSKQPAILINAVGPYHKGDPLLPEDLAMETVNLMHDCRYQQVPGNHMTMMFGAGAQKSVEAINLFVDSIL